MPLGGPITSMARANELAPPHRPVAANVLLATRQFLHNSICKDDAYATVSDHLHLALCVHFSSINQVPWRMPTRLQRDLAFPVLCPELSGPKHTLELMPMHEEQRLFEWQQLNALAHAINPIETRRVHPNEHDNTIRRVLNARTTAEHHNLTLSAIALGMQMRDSNRIHLTSARMDAEHDDYDEFKLAGTCQLTSDIARMFYTARAVDLRAHAGPGDRARAVMEVFEQMSQDLGGNLEDVYMFALRLQSSLANYMPYLHALTRREELTDYNVLPTFNSDFAQVQDDYDRERASKKPKNK